MSDGFNAIGCSNHTEKPRAERDFYATDPKAIDILIEECKDIELHDDIWEPACGLGHLSERLKQHGRHVISTDIVNRGYSGQHREVDFLNCEDRLTWADIVTNPPYSHAIEFVKAALEKVSTGYYVCMFLKIQFLEGKKRKSFLKENPPKYVYVLASRISCAENGDFESIKNSGGGCLCYAWFVWEKGSKDRTIVDIVG